MTVWGSSCFVASEILQLDAAILGRLRGAVEEVREDTGRGLVVGLLFSAGHAATIVRIACHLLAGEGLGLLLRGAKIAVKLGALLGTAGTLVSRGELGHLLVCAVGCTSTHRKPP